MKFLDSFLILSLCALVSCGGNGGGSNGPSPQSASDPIPPAATVEQNGIKGIWQIDLSAAEFDASHIKYQYYVIQDNFITIIRECTNGIKVAVRSKSSANNDSVSILESKVRHVQVGGNDCLLSVQSHDFQVNFDGNDTDDVWLDVAMHATRVRDYTF